MAFEKIDINGWKRREYFEHYFTNIPCTYSMTVNLNLQKGYSYLIPIFTLGKYYEEDGRIVLPLAVQVHHAVCDGFHICRFVNELQELINS